MRGNISTFHKTVIVIAAILLIGGAATLAFFLQKPNDKEPGDKVATSSTKESKPTGDTNASQKKPSQGDSDNNSSGNSQADQTDLQGQSSAGNPVIPNNNWSSTAPANNSFGHLTVPVGQADTSTQSTDTPSQQTDNPTQNTDTSTDQTDTSTEQTPPPANHTYVVKYLDKYNNEIHRTVSEAQSGKTVVVAAEDLFNKGYELLDEETKTIQPGAGSNEVIFRVSKSRELMPLEEFLKNEVDYAHPLKYRQLDFTDRQKDLEDFVIKKVYQHERETGVFYGTKDQAEKIRTTMLNSSFRGAYFRYVTDIRPMPPTPIEGEDNKYQLNIEFVYKEDFDNIEAGEAAITKLYETYKTRVKTDAEKAKFIQDWLLKNVKTRMPQPNEPHYPWVYNSKNQRRIHSPASAVLDGEGVCLTYATTFARMAERFGLDVRVIQGASLSGDDRSIKQVEDAKKMLSNPDTTTYREKYFNHSWNLVKIDGKWHHVDVYHDLNLAAGFKLSDKHQYFLQSDDFMSKLTIEYKGRGPSTRKMNIYKVWNTNRIPAAPESHNQAKNLPDITD